MSVELMIIIYKRWVSISNTFHDTVCFAYKRLISGGLHEHIFEYILYNILHVEMY